jgi:hypothetical protein
MLSCQPPAERLDEGEPEPGQDDSEVVADGGEDDFGGIALVALEMAAR